MLVFRIREMTLVDCVKDGFVFSVTDVQEMTPAVCQMNIVLMHFEQIFLLCRK